MVLAHACTTTERFDGRGAHRSGPWAVGHVCGQALHQRDQRCAVAVAAALPGGKRDQCVIGLGQVAAAQERQGGLALDFVFAVRVDLDLAAGGQRQVAMGFVQGQYMQDVAIRIDLALYLARQVQLPFIDALAFAAARCQAQELNAVAHVAGVAVSGVVANGQFHTTSR
ncbi:hypothetical protein D3C76_1278340 [compost metagenome]